MHAGPRRASSWRAILLCVAALSTASTASLRLAAQEPDAERLFHEAEAASQAGDLHRAIELYTNLVHEYPNLTVAHANLGVVLAHAGQTDEAASEYQEAIKLDPSNSAIKVDLAILRFKQAHYDEAGAILEPIVKAHPEKGQPMFLLADCFMRLGKYQEVITLLDPVFRQDSSDRTLSYLLGRALLSAGDVERGSAAIDRVMRDGNPGEADLLIGARLFALGKHHEAAEALQKAMARNPDLQGGWSLLGRAMLDDEDPAGAESAFRRALSADPNDFEANLYLGGMLRHSGQLDEALPYLDKAYHLRPDSPEAAYQMGAVEAARGQFGLALQYLEPLAMQWPKFQQVHVLLASVYQKLHRPEDSDRERQIVLSLDEQQRQDGKPVAGFEP